MTPETRLKQSVRKVLNIYGIFNYHILQGLGAYKGVPDRIAHHRGRVIYLEIKYAKAILSDGQKNFLDQCKRDGIEYHIIRSIDDLIDVFELPLSKAGCDTSSKPAKKGPNSSVGRR